MMNATASKTILIVDDNENALTALEKLFGDAGFTTHATWSGHEALSLLQSHKFGALLLGGYLADIHSADFLGRLNKMPAKPPVVVMEGHVPTRADHRRYGTLGAFAVVDKGDMERVREAVALCCHPATAAQATVH